MPSQNPLLTDSPPKNTFETLDRVRWADSDPMGIIYYGAYVRLIAVAEDEMFRACGLPFSELRMGRGVWIPRKALTLEFHSPAELDEAVAVQSWFAKIGRTSITMRFDVYRASDRTHRASGALTVVCVERETIRPKPLPEEVKAMLKRFEAA